MGGASVRVRVPRQDPPAYAFEFPDDEGAFTITFFARLEGAPATPLTVASCFDGDAQLGWILTLEESVVLGNDLDVCADDGIEADFSMGNVRVYENRIEKAFMGISSQPSLGGPTYFIRGSSGGSVGAPQRCWLTRGRTPLVTPLAAAGWSGLPQATVAPSGGFACCLGYRGGIAGYRGVSR